MPNEPTDDQVIDTLYASYKSGEQIAAHFRFQHLPPDLQEISKPFARLAAGLLSSVPRTPERTVALRELLESKDAAVRGVLPEWTRSPL